MSLQKIIMGFFSWKTSDTQESISNNESSRGALPVYLICPDDTYYYEDNYDGYGVFGGQDVYALVAKWNAPEACKDANGEWLDDDVLRIQGIHLACGDKNLRLTYPIKFATQIRPYHTLAPAEDCERQGFFYGKDWL